MLTILFPEGCKIDELFQNQKQIYWSGHIKMWFDKWGFLTNTIEDIKHIKKQQFVIVARGANIDSIDFESFSGFIEGPISDVVLKRLGISAKTRVGTKFKVNAAADISVFDLTSNSVTSEFGRPRDMLRSIPRLGWIKSKPYLLKKNDVDEVVYQTFEVPEGWRAIALITSDSDKNPKPVIISNGHLLLCGMPLLDMICQKHSMPYCKHGYWAPSRKVVNWKVEHFLCSLIIQTAADSKNTIYYINHWPDAAKAAFTIRHDYDRPINNKVLDDILGFYKKKQIKCSFQFLNRLKPTDQISKILEEGHEIALHSEASNEKKFTKEIKEFKKTTSVNIKGATCHGGNGSTGHLGAYLFEWAERQGVFYTERLGRDNYIPHPALVPKGVQGKSLECMVMSAHSSLDTGTAPNAHSCSYLMDAIPQHLASGQVVNIMNHPDIHVDELKKLINSLKLDNVWKASHFEIVNWCRITKYSRQVMWDLNKPIIKFTEPLPKDLTLTIFKQTQVEHRVIKAGVTEVNLTAEM